jgi:hypothetical protein
MVAGLVHRYQESQRRTWCSSSPASPFGRLEISPPCSRDPGGLDQDGKQARAGAVAAVERPAPLVRAVAADQLAVPATGGPVERNGLHPAQRHRFRGRGCPGRCGGGDQNPGGSRNPDNPERSLVPPPGPDPARTDGQAAPEDLPPPAGHSRLAGPLPCQLRKVIMTMRLRSPRISCPRAPERKNRHIPCASGHPGLLRFV